MEPDASLSIRDLAEQAGTTVRTIHYYISEGLLPAAQGTTRNASYSLAHLARLRLIAALRDEGLALANIRQRLAPLTDDQALEIVAELDEHLSGPGEAPLTPLGLIEAALAIRTLAEQDVMDDVAFDQEAIAMPMELRQDPPPTVGSASDYLSRLLHKPAAPSPARPGPIPRPKPAFRKPHDSDRPEAWYSFRIDDGIELRIREDRYREGKGRLRSVVDALRTTLHRYGLSPPDREPE